MERWGCCKYGHSGEFKIVEKNGIAGCRGKGCFIKETLVHFIGNKKEAIENITLEGKESKLYVLTYNTIADKVKFIHNNDELPLSERNIDNEDITPSSWKCVEILIEYENGSLLKANLRRPNWWLKQYGANEIGNKVTLSLPEMDVYGIGTVTNISNNSIDTRNFEFQRDKNRNFARPITGIFERIVSETWDYYFDNGEVIGTTPNHPIYSIDRNAFVPVERLAKGERVKFKNGKNVNFFQKKRRLSEEKVYNLEVWRDHNFYVGENGVLVHNSCNLNINGLDDIELNVVGNSGNDFTNVIQKEPLSWEHNFTITEDGIQFPFPQDFKPFEESVDHGFDFIVTANGQLRIGSGHGFLAGHRSASTANPGLKSAGKVYINAEGKIYKISNQSGHFQPDIEGVDRIIDKFKDAGIATDDCFSFPAWN